MSPRPSDSLCRHPPPREPPHLRSMASTFTALGPCIQGGTMTHGPAILHRGVQWSISRMKCLAAKWRWCPGTSSTCMCQPLQVHTLRCEPPPCSRQGSSCGSCATERSEGRIAGRVAWCTSCMGNANNSGGGSRQCCSHERSGAQGSEGGGMIPMVRRQSRHQR